MAVYHRLLKREARERERLLAFEAVVKPRVLGALEGAKIARWHLRVRRASLGHHWRGLLEHGEDFFHELIFWEPFLKTIKKIK